MKTYNFIHLFLSVSVLSFPQPNDTLILVGNSNSDYKIKVEID